MAIIRMSFNRNPFLGAYSLCTDKIALMPSIFRFKEREAETALGVPVVKTDVCRSPLIGVLMAGNSNGLICSELFEIGFGEGSLKPDLALTYLPGKYNAFGNVFLMNDYGAIANPDLPEDILKLVGQKLRVPVVRGTIAGIKNVGAAGVATNRGVLVHPDIAGDEAKLIEKTLNVPVDVGTACAGVKFVGLCMVANSKGAVIGMTTTGPELGRVESALGFI
ncbi:MAG: translation initiation factor IF-6 [Candidatus Hadarchaeaceae archaeon]